ncbi:MAG: 6-bladed beta-propeller [Verrucomicrobiota bacterium]
MNPSSSQSMGGQSRRSFLGTSAVAMGSFLAAPFIRASEKSAPDFHGAIIGHGAFRYRVDKLWSQADPLQTPVNNCHEMVQVRDGRLFLLTDQVRNNVLIYAKSGQLLGSWTLKLSGAHGLTLTTEGDREVLWIVDFKGRVLKSTLEGEVLMELPTAEQCGAYPAGQKYSPTEAAIGPDGQIYVADGYGSQFILRFDREGKFLGKFGGKSELSQGKFLQAHGLVFDTREKEPLLLCTERMKNEFQWFTPNGEFVKSVYLPGAFMSRPVIHGEMLLSGVCFGMIPNDFRPKLNRGFVTILDKENKVVSNPGGRAPRYLAEGQLEVMMQEDPVFQHGHDVCVDDQGDLYVCQWNAGKVYPYKLHRVG